MTPVWIHTDWSDTDHGALKPLLFVSSLTDWDVRLGNFKPYPEGTHGWHSCWPGRSLRPCQCQLPEFSPGVSRMKSEGANNQFQEKTKIWGAGRGYGSKWGDIEGIMVERRYPNTHKMSTMWGPGKWPSLWFPLEALPSIAPSVQPRLQVTLALLQTQIQQIHRGGYSWSFLVLPTLIYNFLPILRKAEKLISFKTSLNFRSGHLLQVWTLRSERKLAWVILQKILFSVKKE